MTPLRGAGGFVCRFLVVLGPGSELFKDHSVLKRRSENRCKNGVKRGARVLQVMPCGAIKEQEDRTTNIRKSTKQKTRPGNQALPDVPTGTVADF